MSIRKGEHYGEEGKNFKFPTALLRQIDECSAGGFLLFAVNDSGEIEQFFKMDDEKTVYAFSNKLMLLSNVLQNINAQHMLNNLIPPQDR